MKVLVLTCNKYDWALRPFSYLFNKYWSEQQEVVVGAYRKVDGLPSNFTVHIIDEKEYPSNRWSDGAINTLTHLYKTGSKRVVIMLEDYWLSRTVDHTGVRTLGDYMEENPSVLRADLTGDRLYNGEKWDIGAYGHYDLVETPPKSPYQMSLQAGIWDIRNTLSCWKAGWSAHDVELQGSPALHKRDDLRVIGTYQMPVRYINAMNVNRGFEKGEFDKLPDEHKAAIWGMLPSEIKEKISV